MLRRLIDIYKSRGYKLNERPYELNLTGLRSKEVQSKKLNDEFFAFYRDANEKWQISMWKCTTDPGTFWLQNPQHEQGTALLTQGLWDYQKGLHKGSTTALVQASPVTVLRDYDRNATIDFYNGTRQTGWFGINIHPPIGSEVLQKIGRQSAGCTVFKRKDDFNQLMTMVDRHIDRYGNNFKYALIDFRAMRKATYKNIALGTTIGAGVIAGAGYYYS